MTTTTAHPHESRWAWAEVDLDAIAHNVGQLRIASAPAEVWAVVKADGYGHGAVEVARTALTAGAAGLCVALASEGALLRRAGIDAPILVLSEQPPEIDADLVVNDLIATVFTNDAVDRLAAAVVDSAATTLSVQVKVDTGMHRVGARPEDVAALAARIAGHAPALTLDGVFTHLAVADEPTDPYTDAQLQQFDAMLAAVPNADDLLIHAANSAAALTRPDARRSLVRAGIAVYGISPGPQLDAVASSLLPALALKARISHVRRLAAGERLSYGLRHTIAAPANIATVPLGYADGVRRGLSGTGTTVLIGGARREIVGTITMDQLMVDCGDDDVAVGDEVVLIGRQGNNEIRAEEWAETLGTIGYEIVCGIGARIPRHYVTAS
jgi:alanine racemase